MKIYILRLFLISILFISCKHDVQKIFFSTNNSNAIEVDLDNSINSAELLFSTYFKEPKTVILETSEDCLIKRIHGIELFDEKIYVHDDKMKRLFVFDMDGKFKYEIGKPGMGPGEYIKLSDFAIDRKDSVVFLWDEAKKNILRYDLKTSEFISSVHVSDIEGQSYSLLFKGGKFYINSTTENMESEKYLLNEIDCQTGLIARKFLPAEDYNKGWNIPLRLPHSNFYSKNHPEPKYTDFFSDTILSIAENGITASYVIKSKSMIPKKVVEKIVEDYYKSSGYIDLTSIYTSEYIYKISNFVEMDKYAYFQYTKGTDVMHSFYDKNRNCVEVSKILKNDYVSSSSYIHMKLMYSTPKEVLAILRTEHLPRFIDAVSAGTVNENLDKYEQLIHLNEESNPILFFHEFKE